MTLSRQSVELQAAARARDDSGRRPPPGGSILCRYVLARDPPIPFRATGRGGAGRPPEPETDASRAAANPISVHETGAAERPLID
jgi:hypothetical protein